MAVKDIPRGKSSDFRRIYATNANLLSSFYDINLIFGVVLPGTESPASIVIEDQASVAMAWEHAKSLHIALGKAIVDYEAAHGSIRDIPGSVV